MDKLNKVLSSFGEKKELEPKIWSNEETLDKKVRTKLISIANEFIEFIGVDIVVSDIIMTGSLSNYNWSNYSDIDLHIVVDFDQFKKEQLPLYEELFKLKKAIFNDKHDIKIYGYEVELYVQNEKESHFSSGVYSVLNNEWLTKPKKENVKLDLKLITSKSKQWMNLIDKTLKHASEGSIEESKKLIEKIKDKLKKYRTCGLEKGGEYSDENLVFKVLRRSGHIEKLFDFNTKNVDKKLSLKEATTTIGGTFKTDLENGPTNHGARAFGNWQSDNAWDIFSSPGTVVNSYTNGVVKKVYNTGKNSGKVFGTQVTVSGEGKFPDIFYTHLKNVKLKEGDKVKVGDYIGVISEWIGHSGMEHVHIGLPKGRHLRELLVNSEIIFTGKRGDAESPSGDEEFNLDTTTNQNIIKTIKDFLSNDVNFKNTNVDKVNENLSDIVDGRNKFMQSFYNILKSQTELKNLQGKGEIPYDDKVEIIQIGLQFLGFLLPKYGVDGRFGNETEGAVKEFQKKYRLNEDGTLTNDDLTKLFSIMVLKDFKDEGLNRIQKKSDISKVNVGNDKQFYEEVLKGIGAPVTDENLKFFYAWRQAEGAKATNNPFNTTQFMKNDPGISKYNKVGVRNYSTPQIGIEATIKTLKNGHYPCILDGLRNNIGADKISRCSSNLKTWGTGEGIARVLDYGKISPPPIYA